MNQHILRLIKIVSFIVVFLITDQVIGFILREGYFHQKTWQLHVLNYAFRDCKADILISGSSRAAHHYDPRILSDRLHLSSYNAGIDGHGILLSSALIKVITKRYLPKTIILEFNPEDILYNAEDYDRLSILLPYYKEYPELLPLLRLRSPYESVKLLSAIYPFNSKIIDIIRFTSNFHVEGLQDFEGYFPIKNKVMNVGMLDTMPEIIQPLIIDTNKIIALKNIISICKEKKITLLIINSPIFHTANEKRTSLTAAVKPALEIIHSEGVKFYDFSFDSTFNRHPEWFSGPVHLNDDGAKIFTNLVSERIIKDK